MQPDLLHTQYVMALSIFSSVPRAFSFVKAGGVLPKRQGSCENVQFAESGSYCKCDDMSHSLTISTLLTAMPRSILG
jgi:hypothetical protein